MPIWKTSELQVGRPGSPRRSRTASGMPAVSGAPVLPPLSMPGDSSYELKAPAAMAGLTGVGAALRPRNDGTAPSTADSSLLPSPTAGAHPDLLSAALALSSPSTPPGKPVKHPQAGGASTYTLQYIGVSNGELGILSQKQKLAPPKPPSGGSAVAATAATSRALSVAHRSRSSNMLPSAGAADGPVGSRPASSASPSPPPIRSTYNPSMHPASPRQTLPHAAAASEALGDDGGGFSPGLAGAAAAVPAGQQQPPGVPVGLQALVEDAHGSVRVVSDCFYSRALHSRAGPRDRHTRRNKPTVPPVQDKEPLSSALPARFGHRAPSAGGFPGWRLTAATAAANAAAAGVVASTSVPGMRGTGGGGGGAPGIRRAYTGNGYGQAAPSPSGSAGSPWQQLHQQQQLPPGEAGEDDLGLGYGYGQVPPQIGPANELPAAGEGPQLWAGAIGGRSFSRNMTPGTQG